MHAIALHVLITRGCGHTNASVHISEHAAYAERAETARASWDRIAGWEMSDCAWAGPGTTVPAKPPQDNKLAGDLYWAAQQDQGGDESCFVEEHTLHLDTIDLATLTQWRNAIDATLTTRQ